MNLFVFLIGIYRLSAIDRTERGIVKLTWFQGEGAVK